MLKYGGYGRMNMNNLITYIKDPKVRFSFLASRGFYNNMPDEKYLKKKYKIMIGNELNLSNPQTFNEKIQWLKLYDRKPIYTTMVDKYKVKKYVSDIIGEEYIIPTIGVWDRFDDIDFDLLPNQFVLKCTHDSGGIVFVQDKKQLDIRAARIKLEKSLKRNYYYLGREWPYKNVKPRILAEKYMQEEQCMDHFSFNHSLKVYKFFTFDGEPYLIQVIQDDKKIDESIDYFDIEWNLLDLRQNYPNSKKHLSRPKHLNEMLNIVSKLGKGHPFLRIDLYDTNVGIFFSEFTFYSDDGMAKFIPTDWDYRLGQKIKIS